MDFADYLEDSGFRTLQLHGPSGMVENCDLLIRSVPRRSIKIGKGCKKLSAHHGFKEGDEIVFQFPFENSNMVNVID